MKQDILLGIDVGNTNITFGVFRGKEILKTFRMTTKMQRTSDEFGVWIRTLLTETGFDAESLKDVIVASVVPGIMHSLNSGIIKYLNKTPIVVEAGMKTGLRINMANPKELGADRVVDCVAGYELYGGPVMVIDFGTTSFWTDVCLKPVSRARASASARTLCGPRPRSFRRLRLRSRQASSQEIPLRVCRQALYTAASDRPNTSSKR